MAFRRGGGKDSEDYVGIFEDPSGWAALVSSNPDKGVIAVSRDTLDLVDEARRNNMGMLIDLNEAGYSRHRHEVPHMKDVAVQAIHAVKNQGLQKRQREEYAARREAAYEKMLNMGVEITPEIEAMKLPHLERHVADTEASASREQVFKNRLEEAKARLDEARREVAFEEVRAMGRPLSDDLINMSTDTLEEYVSSIKVAERAAQADPEELDVNPDLPALEDRLEAAAMDHAFDVEDPVTRALDDIEERLNSLPDEEPPGPDEEPPSPDLGVEPSGPTPGPAPSGAEVIPPAIEDIDLPENPALPPGINSLNEIDGDERAEATQYLAYADKLLEHVPDSPDPEATRAGAMVMRNFPTANAASDREPSPPASAVSHSPKVSHGKSLKR